MKLEPTGERLLVDEYQQSAERYLIYLLHTAAYRFALPYVAGRRVLDYGCGSGYGSKMVAAAARSTVGVDVAPEAVEYARERYGGEGLSFVRIVPEQPLPFEDRSFDVVLSFQVFEHVRDTRAYLGEVERVLAPNGVLILVTPDRRTRLLPFQKPWNRFHVREYTPGEIEVGLRERAFEVEVYAMGGNPGVLAVELARCRRIKWLSLPLTLPLWPDSLRVRALELLYRVRGKSAAGAGPASAASAHSFDETSVRIGKGLWPSVNIVAVATRRA